MSEADLLWYNSSTGETQVWYMRGDTVVNRGLVVDENGAVAPICPPFSIVGAGDMNGDGNADIVWYNSQTGETQVWYMDGHRRVGRGTVVDENGEFIPIGPPFRIVGVGPMDGNGKADIVWYNRQTGETQVWYMDGHQLVGRGTVVDEGGNFIPIAPPFRIVGVGDMDGNGKADIVWYNSETGETQVWYMDGHRLVGRGTVVDERGDFIPVGPPFSIVGVGALEGRRRGKADIVWHNSQTGEIQIWFMDGHGIITRNRVFDFSGRSVSIGPPWSIVGTGDFGAAIPPLPARPTGLKITNVADREISISWNDNSIVKRGFYIHSRGTREGFSDHTGLKTVGRNETRATLGDLNSDTRYRISVVAFNEGGGSPSSNEVEATTPARSISVSKEGAGTATIFVVAGAGFTPNSLVVIQIVDAGFNRFEARETTGGDGRFVSRRSVPCRSGTAWTVSAHEDADPSGTASNAVETSCTLTNGGPTRVVALLPPAGRHDYMWPGGAQWASLKSAIFRLVL